MKTNPSMLPHLFFAVTTLGICCAHGQDNAPPAPAPVGDILIKEAQAEAVSSATGTVFSLEAEALSLTTGKSAIPLVFVMTAATALVDEEEKEVARDLVRKGVAATVLYTTLGEKLLATKVIFTREDLTGSGSEDPAAAEQKRSILTETKQMKDEAARAKAVTAEGNGTLMGFEQILTVRAAGETAVTQYTINNSTLYVDSAGNPVPPHAVRTGAGLHVQFVEDAGRKIATRVKIQSMPAWAREGLAAAENGTAATPGSDAQNTTRTRTTTSTADLADAFIYPPVISLPANPPNGVPDPKVPKRFSDPGTSPANGQVNPNQPNQPNPISPISPISPPNKNRTNPGTTRPGTKSPTTPAQPSTLPAAPGAR